MSLVDIERESARKVFFNMIIHAWIHYIQHKVLNAEPFHEFVPQLRLFFVTQRISGSRNAELPLYQTRYYTPAFPSRSFLSRNAYCISLSVIMLDHKRSYIVIIAWNLSAIGSRRIRTIIVESSYFEDELIGREGVKSIARDTSRISFFFFFKFYIGKFFIFVFFWKDRSVKVWNMDGCTSYSSIL